MQIFKYRIFFAQRGVQYINKYLLFNVSSPSRLGYTRKGIETGGFLVGDKRGCRWGHTRPSLGTHEVVVGDRRFLPLSRTGNGRMKNC